jgi:hypothetical protein
LCDSGGGNNGSGGRGRTRESRPPASVENTKADGYHGIWYTLGSGPYGAKYSGGMGTYTSNHVPMAIYAPSVKKTFFVYGGQRDKGLMIMVSYYDHERGVVPRPTIVRDCGNFRDAHANPALCIDGSGHIWVFSASRHSFEGRKYRSRKPYDIDAFDVVESRDGEDVRQEMAYPQPWWIEGKGFLFLFTQYTGGRELYWRTSENGTNWSALKMMASGGHYQTSGCKNGVVGSAFNYHPNGINTRTDLYYVQTRDFGQTWTTADGKPLTTPLPMKAWKAPKNTALVHDYEVEKSLVYIHDLNFDADGRPVILYLTAKDFNSGPSGDPRQWYTARWTGESWDLRTITTSMHNYCVGCLHIEADGAWRVIGPTEAGPQKWGTGGEMAMWLSADKGATWRKTAQLTADSAFNHSYARRPLNAHPDFYAFWADGDPKHPSESRLYFANRDGKVFQLPDAMKEDFAQPALIKCKPMTAMVELKALIRDRLYLYDGVTVDEDFVDDLTNKLEIKAGGTPPRDPINATIHACVKKGNDSTGMLDALISKAVEAMQKEPFVINEAKITVVAVTVEKRTTDEKLGLRIADLKMVMRVGD